MNPSSPRPIAAPPMSRPTAQDTSTATSVCRADRSHSQPQTKLMAMATSVSDRRTYTLWFSVRPKTFTVTTLMTTMTVFTASE